jgi:HSP20 family protein
MAMAITPWEPLRRWENLDPLPQTVENEKVKAKYDHGILRLTLPKAEAQKYKAVKVNLG